jgi:21S rRNA (GM2251-2'-O)-methyltransferase
VRGEDVDPKESPAAAALRERRRKLEKLRKEKTARGDDLGRQSRRKRFYNSETEFGKDSLVYKLQADTKEATDPFSKISDKLRTFPTGDRKNQRPRTNRDAERSQSPRSIDSHRGKPLFRQDGQRRRVTRAGLRSQQDSHYSRDGDRPRTGFREDQGRRKEESTEESREADLQAALRRKGMIPMTVKYTTAASQFLYGKSVVKAALAQNRRQLYNLYVHASDDRKDSKDHVELTSLAKSRGVPITNITKDRQRLMDKMSMGRPHNGFVLEASPLPQLPITSLGKLEQTPSKLGFHVELAHQTKEEEAINGRDTFIPRASSVTPKPFVLLLHEILDPGNLGALLRTASYLGVDAVGITNRTSSSLTPVVLKSAAGAVEEVAIFTVDSPTEFLENSKRAGWKVYAAVAPPDVKLVRMHKDKFVSTDEIEESRPLDHDPCVLVLGNEGFGLPKPIKVVADHEISVPRFVSTSSVDSLNVSVAAGLLCHSFVKEKIDIRGTKQQVAEKESRHEVAGQKADEQLF